MKRLKTILLFLLTSLALSSCDFLMPRIGQSDNSSSSSSNSNSSNTDTQDGWYDYDVLRGINCGLPYEFHLHQNYNQDYDYKNGQIIEFKYEFLIDGVLRNEYVFVDTDFYNFSYYSNDFRSVILTPNFQGDVGVTFVINNIDDGSLNNVFGVNVHSSQAQKSGYHVGLHFQKTKYVYDQYENICLDFEAYNIRSQQSRYYTTDIYWGDIASDNYTFLDIKPIMAGQYDARFFLEEDNHELAHIRFAINDNGISNNPYLEPFSSNFGVQGKVGEMVELGFNTNYSTAELLSSADFLFSVDNRVLPVDILDNFARFFLNQEGLVDITIILPDGNQVLFGSINVLAYEPIIETESANNPYYLSHKNSVNEINSDYVILCLF